MAVPLLLLIVMAIASIVSQAQEMISVPLKVGDNLEFEVQFIPTESGVRDITDRFCEQRKADFGITDENLDVCRVPVLKYLSSYIKSAEPTQESSSIPEIVVPLKIGESEYEISFEPTAAGASRVATKFCQEQGASFGVTEENFVEGEYMMYL